MKYTNYEILMATHIKYSQVELELAAMRASCDMDTSLTGKYTVCAHLHFSMPRYSVWVARESCKEAALLEVISHDELKVCDEGAYTCEIASIKGMLRAWLTSSKLSEEV